MTDLADIVVHVIHDAMLHAWVLGGAQDARPGEAVIDNGVGTYTDRLCTALRKQGWGPIPAGWAVVPREPTEAMVAPYRGLVRTRLTSDLAADVYRWMLSAAPQPANAVAARS